MSILIKDMEMPENCVGCPCIEDAFHIRCRISGKIVGGTAEINCFDPRPSDCPLITVPDHGRLIDADELKKKHHWTDDFYETEYVEVEDIDAAPTIIPAEEATQREERRDEAPTGPYDILYEEGGVNTQ